MSAVWTTNDGRHIEVRWMQSQHLVHSFNMLLRKHSLHRATVELRLRAVNRARDIVTHMVQELRDRGLYIWKTQTELSIPDVRETPAQLCILRALIDANKSWPGILDFHGAKSCIWYQFDSALDQLQREAATGHKDACAILAKFTEYRLEGRGV
jgi:hypothetical protein